MKAHYSRLFGGPFEGHAENALAQLAERMRDDPEGRNRAGRIRGGDLAVSGFVYFGQFIDHDITRDEVGPNDPVIPPEDRENHRTPLLDLDSLYGNGPSLSKNLYDGSRADRARFRLGATEATEELPSTLDDLPRTEGVTDLGDDRNDENLILAQLHVAFLQFHNRVLDCFLAKRIPDAAKYGKTPFERAQRFVRWHYQYVLLNDFLQTVVLKSVWEKRNDPSWRLFKPKIGGQVNLPVEFTQAAFRFGHSMVQNEYSLQGSGRTRLRDLLLKTPRGKPSPNLRADQVISWPLFLVPIGAMNFAENVDTLIADDMYHLPQAAVAVFWKKNAQLVDMPLPAITLIRGSKIGLPSGQQTCAAYHLEALAEETIGFNQETLQFLRENDMLTRTPLWFYILREAELLGKRTFQGGECLGPLGSKLVMDVLLGVLEADPDSYLAKDPNWEPPEFSYDDSGKKYRIQQLADLVLFAKAKAETN